MAASARDKRRTDAAPYPLGLTARIAISCAVAFHLAAVFIGPFALPPTSQLAARLHDWIRPYNEIHHLDVGYRFFNEPGPSNRIEYQLEFADGRPHQTGIFPDRDEHWPRLLYHRHFMLSEGLNPFATPRTPPEDVPPGSLPHRMWALDKKRFDTFTRSFADHLLYTHGAQRVRLSSLTRRYRSPDEAVAGMKGDDPKLVVRTPLGEFDPQEAAK